MKKVILLLTLVIGLTLSSLGFSDGVLAADTAAKDASQTQCPVMSGNIDKNIYVDYEGKRIYFCCTGCVEEFKKDPAKYLEKMKEQGITPEKAPKSK